MITQGVTMAEQPKRAAKVAPPRRRTAKTTPAGGETTAAAVVEPTEIIAPARTRTSTAGGAARTSTRSRARTAAAPTTEPEIPPAARPGADTGQPGGDGDPAAEDLPETDVEWNGRTWRVRLPNLEQLTIYRRLNEKFQALGDAQRKPDAEPIPLEEATRYFDRALKLITSILVNRGDIEWLEDEMLEGRLTLTRTAGLMKTAFDELAKITKEREAANANRATRRSRGRAHLAD